MSFVINAYKNFFNAEIKDFNKIGTLDYPIPQFPELYILKVCNDVIPILEADPSLLNLEGEFYIIGDLHGNIKDLLRIFACAGSPLENNYIFLGDYVDRGAYSVEVITLLFALKIVRPQSIFLLRGNHEFEDINTMYGFKDQCFNEYSPTLFMRVNQCFTFLPLAAVINKYTFAVHGGISSHLKAVNQISEIPKPAKNYDDTEFKQLVQDMMWSDPTADHKHFFPSLRGLGTLFGFSAIKTFLENNNLHRIIRAHQCVYEGVEDFCYNKLYTVFSSSNYSSDMNNKCGIIKMFDDGKIKCYNFPALKILDKARCVFKINKFRDGHSNSSSKLQSEFPDLGFKNARRNSYGQDAILPNVLTTKSRTLTLKKTCLIPKPILFSGQI